MKFDIDSIVYPLPTDELITDREKKWRVKLPSNFREQLKQFNGAIPEKCSFSIPDDEREYSIERFLCLLGDYHNQFGIYDISVVLTQIELRLTDNMDLLGVEKLPIASLFGGDMLCLDFKKSADTPSVCIWYHDESGEFDPVTRHVADNYKCFVDMLV